MATGQQSSVVLVTQMHHPQPLIITICNLLHKTNCELHNPSGELTSTGPEPRSKGPTCNCLSGRCPGNLMRTKEWHCLHPSHHLCTALCSLNLRLDICTICSVRGRKENFMNKPYEVCTQRDAYQAVSPV